MDRFAQRWIVSILDLQPTQLKPNQIKTSIKIPMKDKIDSLNVSVSTAIIIYEGQRQRDFVDF